MTARDAEPVLVVERTTEFLGRVVVGRERAAFAVGVGGVGY
jgi:hypothetical protein